MGKRFCVRTRLVVTAFYKWFTGFLERGVFTQAPVVLVEIELRSF